MDKHNHNKLNNNNHRVPWEDLLVLLLEEHHLLQVMHKINTQIIKQNKQILEMIRKKQS